ncbi:MAG: hypothetical protein R6V04_07940 [bacterium]
MRLIRLFLFSWLICTLELFSQDIYSTQAMKSFNKGNFDEAISLLNNYAEKYQSNRGKAYYFIGESYYNLSFSDGISNQSALDYISKATDFFEKASQQPDIEGSQYNPQYKKAWCSFRSAELSLNPVSYLIKSATEFSKISETAGSMIYNNSVFMTAESYLRLVQYLICLPEPSWDDLIDYLNSSENLFEIIISNPQISEKKRVIANIRKNDVLLKKVIIDIIQGNSENALNVLKSINYQRLLSGVDHQLKNQFNFIVDYSTLYKLFYNLIINPTSQNRNNVISSLENLSGFSGEKYFINSLTDFIYEGSRQLNNLSNINLTNFENAAQIIPDAWYWLGWLQFLNNDHNAMESFDHYLENTDELLIDSRINFLRESAYYRKLLIRFDNNVSHSNILQEINDNLENFTPENSSIEQEKNTLHSLVRICLGHNINDIIQTKGMQIKTKAVVDKVINLIQEMLERATKVVGKERKSSLNHINNLLQYLRSLEQGLEDTPSDLGQRIIFYDGLKLFLEAEIQPSQDDKRKLFRNAADVLKKLNDLAGKYQYEGNYIRARSFFEAARNSANNSQQNRFFNKAQEIFITLINEKHSLRSTYYLSEIFRLRENFAASYRCYQSIKEKIGEKEKNNFWYVNADAGLDRTKNFNETGNLRVLNDINISSIIYPEALLVGDDEEIISMEKFADSDFLKQKDFNQAIRYYKKYGLPKRSFYPSINSYEKSIFTRRIYTINIGIQERIGELFSNFVVEIICPEGVVYKPSVLLDSLAIKSVENYIFSQDSIKLNTSHILSIKNPDCYPVYKKIQFVTPGTKKIRVRLQYVLSYISSRLSINDFKNTEQIDIIDLSERNDWNILFSNKLSDNREIITDDFQNNIHYRDVVYSKFHNAYFGVRNDTTTLTKYQDNNRTDFNISVPQEYREIFIPEGIAVDFEGNIYIVNWAAHQIFVFDSNGNFLKVFGENGRNNMVGLPVKLTYPTRISVSESTVNNINNMLIYIADRYGIKIVDSNGNFLDSIVKVAEGNEGAYYDLYAHGFGNNTVLYVLNRKSKKIEKFTLTEQH